jgi:prepilin-type N-terminal cleavage/methylation domain-containing protein
VTVRTRAGFTLIELLVALSLSGLVLLGGRLMMEQLATTASGIGRVETTREARRSRDAHRRLLLLQLDSDSLAGARFEGHAKSARFVSWCDMPGGWMERCAVTITADSEDADGVMVRTSTGMTLWQPDSLPVEFRYLGTADEGLSWLTAWDESLVPPVAMALVTMRDTTVLRVGVRR